VCSLLPLFWIEETNLHLSTLTLSLVTRCQYQLMAMRWHCTWCCWNVLKSYGLFCIYEWQLSKRLILKFSVWAGISYFCNFCSYANNCWDNFIQWSIFLVYLLYVCFFFNSIKQWNYMCCISLVNEGQENLGNYCIYQHGFVHCEFHLGNWCFVCVGLQYFLSFEF